MSGKIVSNKDYVAGWLDSSIHDFLDVFPANDASTKYALVTCLDSNPTPACLYTQSPELKSIANKLQVLGNGLLLPTDSLREADAQHRIFFGFDEVCFFPRKSIQPKPPSTSLVGPSTSQSGKVQQTCQMDGRELLLVGTWRR